MGVQNQIVVPRHNECRIDDYDIVASFHTHPNTGNNFLQEPSITDRRAVREDPNLKGLFYVGEFVITDAINYLIQPDGEVLELFSRRGLLKEN